MKNEFFSGKTKINKKKIIIFNCNKVMMNTFKNNKNFAFNAFSKNVLRCSWCVQHNKL